MLDQVEAAFSLWDRFRQWRLRRNMSTTQSRFIRLFAAHGIHRNQIPRFFGNGLELADVQNDDALASKLTAGHVLKASELLGASLEWLELGKGQAHTLLRFYKQPELFRTWLAETHERAKQHGAFPTAWLLMPECRRSELEAVLLIAEPIATFNNDWVQRVHWIPCGPPSYWRARAYMASFVAAADHYAVPLRARIYPEGVFAKKVANVDLLGTQGISDLPVSKGQVDPFRWIADPVAFLHGVDSEQDHYGTCSALELWLSLQEQGLMDGHKDSATYRPKFEAALMALG